MSYKTLMVHLDNEPQAPHVLKAAIQLADKHDAHLIGVYVMHPLEAYAARAADIGMSHQVMSVLTEEENQREERLRDLFRAATANQSFVSEWRYLDRREGPVVNVLVDMATAVDALVISGPLQDQPTSSANEFVERVVSESARPVFVIPENYDSSDFGSHMFIAFDGSREASRAVFDSLPQLALAEKIWLHRESSDESETDLLINQTSELASTLSHHDIDVEVTFGNARGRQAGSAVLQQVQDQGANCVVMGGFGKNTLRRLYFGNTSRQALNTLKVPVVMSH